MNKGTQSGIDTKTEEMTTSEASIDAVLSFVKDVYPQKYKTLLLTKEALKPEFVTNVSYEKNKFFAPTMDNTGRELDTLLCVVNFGNDKGFAIVSTQDNQILAVTESGDLSVEELIMDYSDEDFENNPKAVISNYVANYISSFPTIPIGPIGPTIPPGGPAIPTDSIDMGYAINGPWEIESQLNPLVQIKIGQQNGYNKYCKNSVDSLVAVGCGTIAIVQMMSANKYPNTIGNLTYNWDTIINQYKTNPTTKDALAQWIRTIGGQCNIDYYNSRSGCNIIDMKNCISFYQRYYNVNYISNPSFENVFVMLTNNTPLVFLGWRITEKNDTSGHAWVIDGYITKRQLIKFYDSNMAFIEEFYQYQKYVHCNWGWEGKCDGYYAMNIFDLRYGAPIPDETTPKKEEKYYNIDIKAITYNLE